ncbi:hypothetical protein QQF64_034958 [Cirrhinus molitorella]|uniref:Uncharacterized protein n=1 Tax=Cirrhinus molitorella TaxID=172907 RepID=A0ABR3NF86_9TELE
MVQWINMFSEDKAVMEKLDQIPAQQTLFNCFIGQTQLTYRSTVKYKFLHVFQHEICGSLVKSIASWVQRLLVQSRPDLCVTGEWWSLCVSE